MIGTAVLGVEAIALILFASQGLNYRADLCDASETPFGCQAVVSLGLVGGLVAGGKIALALAELSRKTTETALRNL